MCIWFFRHHLRRGAASCEPPPPPPLQQLQLEVWDGAVVGSGGMEITRRSRGDTVRVEDTVIRVLETFLRHVGPY